MNKAHAPAAAVAAGAFALAAAACSGSDAVLFTDSMLAASAAAHPPIMRAVDGIPGWKRVGAPERYNKDGLYGYIDGGAEIFLQYGFRELSVFKFRPVAAPESAVKEVILEIYRMESGPAAFGIYSTKLEGEESGWPGLKPDHWLVLGQANLVKGDFLLNILGPECTDREIGEFMAAVERRLPASRTVRPKGMSWLPREGMVPGSGRFIRGPLAARNESPFLEGDFWGFGGAGAGAGETEAYSARYGPAPDVSKLVVIKFSSDNADEKAERKIMSAAVGSRPVLSDQVLDIFREFLIDVRRDGDFVEGRNQAGRWFLFKAKGPAAALVLGESDRAAAFARLDKALALSAPR